MTFGRDQQTKIIDEKKLRCRQVETRHRKNEFNKTTNRYMIIKKNTQQTRRIKKKSKIADKTNSNIN